MTVSVEMLHRLLICDAETGRLFWRARTADLFRDTAGRTAEHACAIWNARYAGQPALNCPQKNGYRAGSVLNATVYAHRAILALLDGFWPAQDVDHINGDRTDNRAVNLRSVSRAENARNKCVKPGLSGAVGVHVARRGKWAARIGTGGRALNLGQFDSVEEAAERRRIAEAEMGFHPNHGRAA